MSTNFQPPRAPGPPPPPQSGSHVVAIALLGLAFIVVVCVFGIWIGFRVLTHTFHMQVKNGAGGENAVSIDTPFGGIEVNKNVNEASLGLPIYPGSHPVPGRDGATLNMQFGKEAAARIVVAKFQTGDGFEKVRSFYDKLLTSEFGKFTVKDQDFDIDPGHWDNREGNFTGRDSEGKTFFEIKRKDYVKVAAMRVEGDGTRIDLVRVSHGKGDTN